MIVVPASAPSPTPAPTLASAYGAIPIRPRQTNDFDYSCFNVNDALQCTSILGGCYNSLLEATALNSAITSCYCTYGVSYLDCFYSRVATGSCASYYSVSDWGKYQMDFYTEYCGSIPPSAMAHIQPPSSVSLDFETINIVTATGALQQPNYGGQPNYKGVGELLTGPCTATDFTLVDAGNTVYYAGFQGCNKNRPECCPWPVATAMAASGGTAADGAGANAKDNAGYDFPQPSNKDMAQLASCADDYYSISGGCCPNGFWPFTSEVGGITPCWSSIDRVVAPTLTVEKDAKTMDKPTSAVVNIVWSMRYQVADPGGGGLSTAAKAGIGAGAGVAAILIAGLAICLWRSRRKNKKLAQPQQQAVGQVQGQSPQQQPPSQQPPMMQQQALPPNGQYPPGAIPPGMVAPAPPPASDRASMMTSVTPVSATALVPQHTGASNGGVSELSSQSGKNLLHNVQPGGYANPRGSYGSNSGSGSPAVGGNGNGNAQVYPAPIAEQDEGQYPQHAQQQAQAQHYAYHQHHRSQQQQYPQPQHGYQEQQQQQHYYAAGGYEGPGQDQGQGGYAYVQQQPQQQSYPAEMSASREPQEVMGSRTQQDWRGQ